MQVWRTTQKVSNWSILCRIWTMCSLMKGTILFMRISQSRWMSWSLTSSRNIVTEDYILWPFQVLRWYPAGVQSTLQLVLRWYVVSNNVWNKIFSSFKIWFWLISHFSYLYLQWAIVELYEKKQKLKITKDLNQF